jgi:hypothetical protein
MGINNAKAILILLSRQYKDSPICRLAAEHVIASNKEVFFVSADPQFKPDGWLNGVIGNSVIYTLCTETFDANFDIVLQELEMHERLRESDANIPLILPWASSQLTNFQCWSVTQVVDWLETNGLAGYQVPFAEHNVDGITLKNLIQLGKQGILILKLIILRSLFDCSCCYHNDLMQRDIRGLSSILYHYFGIKNWKHQARILNIIDKLL